MNPLRRLGLFAAGMVFRSMLLLTITSSALVVIAGNADHLKDALTATKLYERIIPSFLEASSAQNQSSASIPLSDPAVVAIVNDAFPPKMIQDNAEMVIDSIYSWLNGKVPAPVFRIDLTANKKELASELGRHAVTRLAAQPVCTVLPAHINPFTATCRPAGFTPDSHEKPLVEQIETSPALLPKTVFTADDLPRVRSGQTVTDRYNYAPAYYKWIMWSPWVFALFMLVSGAAIVLLNRSARIGLYRIGFEVLSNGVLFMASPIIFGYALPSLINKIDVPAAAGGGGGQSVINDAFVYYGGYFNNFFINAGIYLSLAGLLALMTARAMQTATGYGSVRDKAGLTTSNAPRPRTGKLILTADTVPIQSSDTDVAPKKSKRTGNRKYRTIPKKEM